MLADPKADALVENFAGQWLYLRELANVQSEATDFDDNLRQAFRRETEMLFGSIVREDRSLLDAARRRLHVRGRAARAPLRHPGVRGSYFRRVPLPADSPRRGLLGPGQLPDGDLDRHAHVAGVARQVGAREPARRAAAAAAAGRRSEPRRGSEGGQADHAAAAAGGAPREPGVRVVPQDHGPDGVRARELRPGRRLARARRPACRSTPPASSPTARRSTAPADLRNAVLSRSDAFMTVGHRKAADLRARPAGARHRHADGARDRPRARRRNDQQFSSLVLGVVESAPFQKRIKKSQAQTGVRRIRHMAFLTRNHLSRRTFLRGAGVVAGAAAARLDDPGRDAARPDGGGAARTRFGAIYFPHGAIMNKWTPADGGRRLRAVARSCSRSSRSTTRSTWSASLRARAGLRQRRHRQSQPLGRGVPERRVRQDRRQAVSSASRWTRSPRARSGRTRRCRRSS